MGQKGGEEGPAFRSFLEMAIRWQRDARPQPAASCAGDAAADAFHPSGAVLATAATEVDDPSPDQPPAPPSPPWPPSLTRVGSSWKKGSGTGIHDGEAVSGANADGPHPHVIAIQS